MAAFVRDMEALRLEDPQFERGVFIPAAGVPWFVTLFGRDALIVSMQGISGFPEFAAALRRLSNLQATEDDPERDMEPGRSRTRSATGARAARDPAIHPVTGHTMRRACS